MRSAGLVLLFAAVATAATVTSATSDVAAAPSTAPAFEMVEGGDSLQFFPPETVRLERPQPGSAPKVCQTDLPRNGNMWSGRDVANGFANPEVQKAITGNVIYKSSASTQVTFRIGTNRLWLVPTCTTCAPPPKDVEAFESMMRGVLMNRRLLCP